MWLGKPNTRRHWVALASDGVEQNTTEHHKRHTVIHKTTNLMKHTASWKAERRPAYNFFPRFSWNPKITSNYQIRNAPFSGFRGSFPGLNWPNSEVDHHLYLVTRLGMSGSIPLLPLYAFMAWTGTNTRKITIASHWFLSRGIGVQNVHLRSISSFRLE
jgi:hypothetical protein